MNSLDEPYPLFHMYNLECFETVSGNFKAFNVYAFDSRFSKVTFSAFRVAISYFHDFGVPSALLYQIFLQT